ncbi:uncharacterized protein L201_004516 [Kwoniella dendrophila CBS 6074]|uniref:Uncharacterized protein n=1 Tax=Kwoniella dendrophila CBS 6074 TaxID=1295534 RepID=A0AAX4JVY3_9TREE
MNGSSSSNQSTKYQLPLLAPGPNDELYSKIHGPSLDKSIETFDKQLDDTILELKMEANTLKSLYNHSHDGTVTMVISDPTIEVLKNIHHVEDKITNLRDKADEYVEDRITPYITPNQLKNDSLLVQIQEKMSICLKLENDWLLLAEPIRKEFIIRGSEILMEQSKDIRVYIELVNRLKSEIQVNSSLSQDEFRRIKSRFNDHIEISLHEAEKNMKKSKDVLEVHKAWIELLYELIMWEGRETLASASLARKYFSDAFYSLEREQKQLQAMEGFSLDDMADTLDDIEMD